MLNKKTRGYITFINSRVKLKNKLDISQKNSKQKPKIKRTRIKSEIKTK
jgi:hypothetical protein